ncbi:MAG TPA: hypothetical protein VME01_08340 [Solirubrobacteraceae bacterium]|nr:hypothetical protein [Solirubrobacteraceae bacterium]
MSRSYPFLRSRMMPVLGSLAVCAAVAGCGGASTGSTTPATAAPAGAASSGDQSSFDAQLAAQPSVGVVSGARSHSSSASSASSGGSLAAASDLQTTPVKVTKPATHTSTTKATTPPKPATTTTSTKPAATKKPVSTTPAKVTKPAATTQTRTVTTPAKPVVRYVTVVKYKTRTQTKYQTKYETKTVTVAPKVPAGAFLPSTKPALSLTKFAALGGTIACEFGGGSVRCDVANPSFNPPSKPATCTQSWGSGIVLTNNASAQAAQFACGGTGALGTGAAAIKNGYDDTVGSITCQVRSFGVDCFGSDKRGFILSQTGYVSY